MLLFIWNVVSDVVAAHQIGFSSKYTGLRTYILYAIFSALAGYVIPWLLGMNFKIETANTILTATGILIPTTVAILTIVQGQSDRYKSCSEYEIHHDNKELSGLLKIHQENARLDIKRKAFRRLFVFIAYATFLSICIFALDFIVLIIFGGFDNHVILGRILFGLVIYCGIYCLESLKVLYYMLDDEMSDTTKS